MRVFDFDNTHIQRGKRPRLLPLQHPLTQGRLKYLFVVLWHFFRYKLSKPPGGTEQGIKAYAIDYVRSFQNPTPLSAPSGINA